MNISLLVPSLHSTALDLRLCWEHLLTADTLMCTVLNGGMMSELKQYPSSVVVPFMYPLL